MTGQEDTIRRVQPCAALASSASSVQFSYSIWLYKAIYDSILLDVGTAVFSTAGAS